MAQTLYDRIGGEAALAAAVDGLYRRIIADDSINRFFADIDMSKQRRKMKSFLSYAFGAKTPFGGQSMRDAHARLVEQGLNDSHFDAVKNHILSTLQELQVKPQLIDEVMGITESTREDVLNR